MCVSPTDGMVRNGHSRFLHGLSRVISLQAATIINVFVSRGVFSEAYRLWSFGIHARLATDSQELPYGMVLEAGMHDHVVFQRVQ